LPVGNDVVDLQDPGNQPGAIHPGFDRRVFCASELGSLDAAPTDFARHVLRWTYWAAKESTFKLVQQRDDSISFRPRSFTVSEAGPGQVDVTFDGSVYLVTLDITDQRVHAIARTMESDALPLSGVDGSVTVPTAADASKLVRAQAARTIGKHLGIAAEEISIEGRIPRAKQNGEQLPVELSLSHHGRYLAHAVIGATAFLTIGLSGCSDSTGPGSMTATAKSVWQTQAIDSYAFDYQRSCFCGFIGPVRITVEAGVVTAVESLQADPPDLPPIATFPTIDDLLDQLENAAAADPVLFDVVFDEVRGYPVSAIVDISLQIADEEFGFDVSNFEVASG